jgi:hypothetical protein
VPQVKAKGQTGSGKVTTHNETANRPTLVDARELIDKMLDYEAAAQIQGLNLSSGRFEMLTASERQFYRAELIADYIRLSAGNMGNTQGYYDAALDAFTSKICDMKIPSHELIGTYLAAVDLVAREDHLSSVPGLGDAVRRTMPDVLQACVNEMGQRTERAA